MTKKKTISPSDYKDWFTYTEEMKDVYDKDINVDLINEKIYKNKIRTIDLHGLSLENANINIKKFINESFEKNFRKIKVITGKGNRSKVQENPYVSCELSVLKNSVPEFIKNDTSLIKKIQKIYKAKADEGGEGVFYILLKKLKNKF